MEFVSIPAGEFLMGSTGLDNYANNSEKPQHTVNLDGFLIGKYDVTNAQFAAFTKATHRDWTIPTDKENHPVLNVSWKDAIAFCQWISQISRRTIQLPTEAQWEKAAQDKDGIMFPWGVSEPDASKLNYNDNIKDTTPVGKYSPAGDSRYGAADMAGNVWQWTADWYDENYYSNSPVRNPQGPALGLYKVVRGGAWDDIQNSVRTASRFKYAPYFQYDIGFRVVIVAAPIP